MNGLSKRRKKWKTSSAGCARDRAQKAQVQSGVLWFPWRSRLQSQSARSSIAIGKHSGSFRTLIQAEPLLSNRHVSICGVITISLCFHRAHSTLTAASILPNLCVIPSTGISPPSIIPLMSVSTCAISSVCKWINSSFAEATTSDILY